MESHIKYVQVLTERTWHLRHHCGAVALWVNRENKVSKSNCEGP